MILVLVMTVAFMIDLDSDIDDDIARGHVCGGMTPSWQSAGYECCSACEDAGMTFVKYEHDSGFFHATVKDCHCRINNTYVQIW